VLMEDSWGNAVYFVIAGWVKVRRHSKDEVVTLAILSRGDFFGEMAVLDESPRSTDVIALSPVKLLSIPAQKFVQTLFKDPQLHHRMLQLMVRRLRQTNYRFQLHKLPSAIKLANTLTFMGENYGHKTSQGIEIFNIPLEDLANVTDISLDETTKIMEKLESKGILQRDFSRQVLRLTQFNQLSQLAKRT
ncbi:MAG: Crp/Fnr family transcriptional regulator, partial [Leptolyngbyaceae cyanobacterium bins.59]|nr:Crp/Fnr family transcriptional regulator [Leptolyngbyaceae cyanobacterium bins.59]